MDRRPGSLRSIVKPLVDALSASFRRKPPSGGSPLFRAEVRSDTPVRRGFRSVSDRSIKPGAGHPRTPGRTGKLGHTTSCKRLNAGRWTSLPFCPSGGCSSTLGVGLGLVWSVGPCPLSSVYRDKGRNSGRRLNRRPCPSVSEKLPRSTGTGAACPSQASSIANPKLQNRQTRKPETPQSNSRPQEDRITRRVADPPGPGPPGRLVPPPVLPSPPVTPIAW